MRQIESEASAIWREATTGSSGIKAAVMPPNTAERETERIHNVLMKFQRNQFAFYDGSSGPAEVNASAVYLFTSKPNHSCSPNVVMKPKIDLAAAKPTNSGAPLPAGAGRVVATTLVDVSPGTGLTFNYGPAQLVEWPLEQRRAYLLAKHGFKCMCPRCEREETVALPPPPEGNQSASAMSGGAMNNPGPYGGDMADVGSCNGDGATSRALRIST